MNKFFYHFFVYFTISINAFSEFYVGVSASQVKNSYTVNNEAIGGNNTMKNMFLASKNVNLTVGDEFKDVVEANINKDSLETLFNRITYTFIVLPGGNTMIRINEGNDTFITNTLRPSSDRDITRYLLRGIYGNDIYYNIINSKIHDKIGFGIINIILNTPGADGSQIVQVSNLIDVIQGGLTQSIKEDIITFLQSDEVMGYFNDNLSDEKIADLNSYLINGVFPSTITPTTCSIPSCQPGPQAELERFKTSDSTVSFGLSILTGYRKTDKLFFVGSEFEIDLRNVVIPGNYRSLTLRYDKTASLKGQLGLNISKNNALYLNFGSAARKVNVSYSGLSFKFDETKIMFYGLIGTGYETKIDKNWAMFLEYNQIFALNSITTEYFSVKDKTEQFKVGVRYFF
jgi:hypothetical protein